MLGSSSSGNSTLVRCDDHALLIDAGFSMPEIRTRLHDAGLSLDDVEGILVTHEHSDHARGLGKFVRRAKTPVAANEATAHAIHHTFGVSGVRGILNGAPIEFAGFRIRPIAVPHDSADCAGYEIEADGKRLAYATDLGSVPAELVEAGRRSDAVVLESNHDHAMLWGGQYPQFLKERITGGRGHLSNELAGEAVAAMAGGRLRRVVLAHLSEANNRPLTAVAAVEGALRRRAGLAAFDVQVEAAPKDGPRRVAVA